MDLQPEMRNMLMRNGLQAHVALDGSGYRLIVQGHNSPLLVYPISERQMLALTDWGTNTANKKAYNVLTSIVGKDFYMPKNFVHARNANGRVAMGLHGYRIGIGEYGRMGRMGMPPPFLGWTPRNQWGLHLRRVGGQLFFPGPSNRAVTDSITRGINRRNPYSNGTFCRTCRRSSRRWSAVRAAGNRHGRTRSL